MIHISIARERAALARFREPRMIALHDTEVPSLVGMMKIAVGSTEGLWESHPRGDELLMVLEGRLEFTLRPARGAESVVAMAAGDALLIPKDVAHSGRILEDATLFFLTPELGTETWSEAAEADQ